MIIQRGMYHLLDAALEALIDAHDKLHQGKAHHHPEESDTLGDVIFHNGELIEAVAQGGGRFTPRGSALTQLENLRGQAPAGWVGYVLSDMRNNWYRVDWEEDFLMYSADEVKDRFYEIFQKVDV